MSTVDVDQLKRVLTQATFRRPAGPTITRSRDSRSPELRREVEDGIKSVLTGGRLDPNRLAKLRELNQNELRRGAEQRAADDARPAADNTSFIRGIQETRKTLELIAHSDRLSPLTFVTIDQPFLIWQTPTAQPGIFVDSVIEPFVSRAKILINTNQMSDSTSFNFYFYWRNDGNAIALMNVFSKLIINGSCSAQAAPCVLFTNEAKVSMLALLSLLEWWNQPPTYPMAQQSVRQTVAFLDAKTYGTFGFGSPDQLSQSFSFVPYDLSYRMFAVPPQSVAVFEVGLNIEYGFNGGELNLEEGIIIDFADDQKAYSVICPYLQLEIFVPQPVVSVP